MAKKTPQHPTLTEAQYEMIVNLLAEHKAANEKANSIATNLLSLYKFVDEQHGTSVATGDSEIHTDRTVRPKSDE